MKGFSFSFPSLRAAFASGVRAEDVAAEALANVHFLGPKSLQEVAAYSQHFDVCMLPYVVNDYTIDPDLIARLEPLPITLDVTARVVINERTGTIVAGGGVHINEVMVTYGSVVISTQVDPFVSQPGPLATGETDFSIAPPVDSLRSKVLSVTVTDCPPSARSGPVARVGAG